MTTSFRDQIKLIEADLIDGIAEVRKRKGLTQEQLSKKVGASSNLMNKLEAHKRGLEAALVVKLAEAMHMTEGALIRQAKSYADKARELRASASNVKL
jgi:transcriptional regulator with XRE-family HTH domain